MTANSHSTVLRILAIAVATLAVSTLSPVAAADAAVIPKSGPATTCRSMNFTGAQTGFLEIYPRIAGSYGETFWLALTVQQATYDNAGNFVAWQDVTSSGGWIQGTLSGDDVDDVIHLEVATGTYYRVWVSYYANWGNGWSVKSSFGTYGQAIGFYGLGAPVSTPYCYLA